MDRHLRTPEAVLRLRSPVESSSSPEAFMARQADRSEIYEAVDLWKRQCLEQGGSVFHDETIWTEEALDELHEHFVEDPRPEGGGFMDKLEDQLADASAAACKLAAEMLWVMLLYPISSSISPGTKRSHTLKAWSWSDEELDEDHELLDDEVLGQGIGNPGQGYNAHRPEALQLFIRMRMAWGELEAEERQELLRDPWEFAEWLDQLEDARNRQFRDILLHLLFPESFERVTVTSQKRDIASAFETFLPDDEDLPDSESDLVALDRRLRAIRERVETELDLDHVDFYDEPFNRAWDWSSGHEETLSRRQALRERGQIVLYGPPGTGKTFDANRLARRAIEAAVISEEKGDFFKIEDSEWEKLFNEHIVRRQLHPAYSYEDFIVGLHITEEGGTEYRDGLLLRLTQRMKKAAEEDERYGHYPFVLILDEINRADLARLFGEAFSAFEDRGEEIMVAAPADSEDDVHGRPLCLPENLLVIGTMNLIDQSLEQIDFALRRRFAWFEHTFNEEALREVARARWKSLADKRGLREDSWEQILPEIERLQVAARRLNDEIRSYEYLGSDYVVGHTYFSETLPMVADRLKGRSRGLKNFYWSSSGPLAPLRALWNHHLKPLLEQYLAGLETDLRDEKIAEWHSAFTARPEQVDA